MANSFTYLGVTYNDETIVSGSFTKSESLNMAELPIDTAEITVRPKLHLDFFTHEPYPMFTRDKLRFKTSEANPFAEQFEQNTPLVQYKDNSQTAIWYLQSIDRLGTGIYQLNGISSLGRLTQRTHYGGLYSGVQAQTILADIIGDIPYYVDNVFKTVRVYGWLPIATARDNLQQLLFALNANLRTDATGTLRIENLSTATKAYIGEEDIFQSGANVKYNTPVTKVVVLEHQYVAGMETRQLFDGTITGTQTITFDEPMSNLSAAGLTIVSSGANYAVVTGTGTLTGTPYIHMTREITRDVTNANIENVIRVENATLVGITNSNSVADRLTEYYAYRNVINVAVAQAFLNVGDVANVFDPYDEEMRSAVIETCKVKLSATTKSSISALVGFVPWQEIPFEDVRIVVTSNETVTIPENASGITVVIIGGGNGGYSGGNGHPGDNSSGDRQGYTLGNGGAGGIAGNGGTGGKILRSELIPGAYAVTIGTGGAGGTPSGYSSNAGASGSATIISGNGVSLSSESGESLPNGYTDPITGDTFAQTGTSGVAGVGGGKRSSLNGYASNGEALTVSGTTWRGGYGGGVQERYNDYQQVWWIDYHGGGGGAAFGNRGGDAPTSIENNNGGAGANASIPPLNTGIGNGGNGGNGGGGGGGAGVSWWFNGPRYGSASGGAGGSGSQGGTGSSGGAIFYYRVPVAN